MTLRRTLHLWGRTALWQHAAAPRLVSAPARCGRLARLWGIFLLLSHVLSCMPPWHAPFPALPSLTLCLPASASTTRSNSRGNAPSLIPLSAPVPWLCPAPCLLALPHLALPLFPGRRVSGLLSLCPLPPSVPSACTVQSNARGNPPIPSFPCCPLVSWAPGMSHALCTSHDTSGGRLSCGCGSTPRPEPPLAAGGQLGRGAPRRSCPGSAHSCRGAQGAVGPCVARLCPLASISLPPPFGQREHGA